MASASSDVGVLRICRCVFRGVVARTYTNNLLFDELNSANLNYLDVNTTESGCPLKMVHQKCHLHLQKYHEGHCTGLGGA